MCMPDLSANSAKGQKKKKKKKKSYFASIFEYNAHVKIQSATYT